MKANKFLKDNNNFEIAYSNYKVLDEKKIESLKYNKLLPSGKITNDLLKKIYNRNFNSDNKENFSK